MCDWGDTVLVRVRTPAELSHEKVACWRHVQIDQCIAPIIEALQTGGIDTLASCCGHGEGNGSIDLVDGRRLVIEEGHDIAYILESEL